MWHVCMYVKTDSWSFMCRLSRPYHAFGIRTDGLITSDEHPIPEGVALWSQWDRFDWIMIVLLSNGIGIAMWISTERTRRSERLAKLAQAESAFAKLSQAASTINEMKDVYDNVVTKTN